MFRRIAVLALILAAALPHALAQEGNYQGLYYTVPPGWTSGEQDGQFILAPTDMTEANAVVVALGGVEKLSGKPFDDWFRAKLASGLNAQLKVLQEGQVQSGNAAVCRRFRPGGPFRTRGAACACRFVTPCRMASRQPWPCW